MALSDGMLARLEKLVSRHDEHLLMLVLERGGRRYGYLREIRRDVYVFAEVKRDRNGALKFSHINTGNPQAIFLYREISPDELPAKHRVFAG